MDARRQRLIDALIELKEDRLEANGAANDAEAATTEHPAAKPKRAPKRRSKKRPKPGLLDGIDTSDLSADERDWCAVAPPSKSP